MQDSSGRIIVDGLSRTFGSATVVDGLNFTVEPHAVTGFLGPNGSGKTTALRMILGLLKPTSGTATINGVPFTKLDQPARVVGSVLDAQGFHPARKAIDHLRIYAEATGTNTHRADELLNLVGLSSVARQPVGRFSLGMRQRMAIATALVANPRILVLDEPANGLDPEGVAWLRSFLHTFARSGGTVLISSHILAEVEQTVDNVVILSRGRTMYQGSIEQLRAQQQHMVLVASADSHKLAEALLAQGVGDVRAVPDGRLAVGGATVEQIGDIAAAIGVATYGMQDHTTSLEQLYFQLTQGQFATQAPTTPPGWDGAPPAAPSPGNYNGQFADMSATRAPAAEWNRPTGPGTASPWQRPNDDTMGDQR